LKFFLRGVSVVSHEATQTARNILALREAQRQTIAEKLGGSAAGSRLLGYLFEQPLATVRMVERALDCSYATANKLVEQLVEAGTLREMTGWQRNRRYQFEPYVELFRGPYREPTEQ
jgi:Fic family protein